MKMVFLGIGISIIKMIGSSDRLIFIMRIPILVRRCLDIEMGVWYMDKSTEKKRMLLLFHNRDTCGSPHMSRADICSRDKYSHPTVYLPGVNQLTPPPSCRIYIYARQWIESAWFRYWLDAYSAPSHYLKQCWVIVNWTLMNKPQWNFNCLFVLFVSLLSHFWLIHFFFLHLLYQPYVGLCQATCVQSH